MKQFSSLKVFLFFSNDTEKDCISRILPSLAAATVPEYNKSVPIFWP